MAKAAVAVGTGFTFKVLCLAEGIMLMSETDPSPLVGLAMVLIELKNIWIGRPSLAVFSCWMCFVPLA